MKKQRRKSQKRGKTASNSGDMAQPDRRSFLSSYGKLLIGAALIGGGSVFAVSAVRATAREQDISRIGQGVPIVVQIHDPGCALCADLQNETRKALESFDSGELEYVVANVKTDEGQAFAARHRQPHVTLMLMGPEGTPVQILNGPQNREDLRRIFERFAATYR